MLEITFQYTKEDLVRGNRFVLFRRLWWKKYLVAYVLLSGVGLIVFAFAQPAADWRDTFILIGIVFLLIALGTLALEQGAAKLIAAQILRNNAHVRYPQTYAFDDEHLTVTGKLFDANLKWLALVEAAETETDFFLFLAKDQAYVLPKRVFKADEETQLRDFLKAKLQDRAKLN